MELVSGFIAPQLGDLSSFLVNEDLSSFLVNGQSLPSIPCNEDVSTMAACFTKACKRVTRWKCNLGTEATSHDICHALLVRVTGPAHTQEGEIPGRYELQRQGHSGPSQNLPITGFLGAASSKDKAEERTVSSMNNLPSSTSIPSTFFCHSVFLRYVLCRDFHHTPALCLFGPVFGSQFCLLVISKLHQQPGVLHIFH